MMAQNKCDCVDRKRTGVFPLLLPHFPDCPEFGMSLRELIQGLVRGIEAWAGDEDGVHPACWQWYQRAKHVLGEMDVANQVP